MTGIESAVILRQGGGYVAYLRFKNRKFDINISHIDKYFLYRLVEAKFVEASL